MSESVGQKKQFGKGQRTVTLPAQKAQKWYPVDDEPEPKKVSIPYAKKKKKKRAKEERRERKKFFSLALVSRLLFESAAI